MWVATMAVVVVVVVRWWAAVMVGGFERERASKVGDLVMGSSARLFSLKSPLE